MRSFQLDQNSNHKRLAEKCNAEGKCFVQRLPNELKDKEDPVVLAAVLANNSTLLTMDFNIVADNGSCIPQCNPGIIVVKARPNTAELMTRILARFKERFPQWAEVDWSQVYAEIDESEVYVSPLVDGNIEEGRAVLYTAAKFEYALTDALLKIKPRCIK